MAIKYLDAKRLRGTSAERKALGIATPTWEADLDMSSPYSNGWTAAASSKIGLDAANDDISFNFDASGSNENLVFDLRHSSALDGSDAHATNWVLRFKLIIDNYVRSDGAGNGAFIGLGSANSTVVTAAAQDFIGMVLWNSTGSQDQTIRTTWANNENTATNGYNIITSNAIITANNTGTSDAYYVEIKRTADDTFSVRMTAEPDYSGTLTGGYHEVTNVDASGVTALRYFKMSNYSGGSGNPNDIVGRLYDLKFWNGVTTVEKTINLPNGTIFEETNPYGENLPHEDEDGGIHYYMLSTSNNRWYMVDD